VKSSQALSRFIKCRYAPGGQFLIKKPKKPKKPKEQGRKGKSRIHLGNWFEEK